MLDIKFIQENRDLVEKAAQLKGVDLDLDELLQMDKKRRDLLLKIEELNSMKNDVNELIQSVKDDKEREEVIAKAKEIKKKTIQAEKDYAAVKNLFEVLMARVPNIVSEDTPAGNSSEQNRELKKWGEIPKFDFKIKDHIELGRELDIIDFERGAKVSGYRGYYLKKEGALLAMALMMYAFHKMTAKGYQPIIPPTIVKSFVLFGSGYFKGVEFDPSTDEVYLLAASEREADGTFSREKKFLIGTAEPSLLAYHSDEVLDFHNLPVRFCGFSPCYRSEIGSYGKDTRGLYRVHEFMKVEQVILCEANIDQAEKYHQEMVNISQEMYQELGLPHRLVQICAGEMGIGKYKMFDIEVWIPSRNAYGEAGSASNFLDWQARRLNVKYADKDRKKRYVYMLNNTALATPRTIIAILENFQQADGSVRIPEVLRKWMPENKDQINPS